MNDNQPLSDSGALFLQLAASFRAVTEEMEKLGKLIIELANKFECWQAPSAR